MRKRGAPKGPRGPHKREPGGINQQAGYATKARFWRECVSEGGPAHAPMGCLGGAAPPWMETWNKGWGASDLDLRRVPTGGEVVFDLTSLLRAAGEEGGL